MAANVIKSISYAQISFLKREILSLLAIVLIHFLVLRFTISPPDYRAPWDEESEKKCESQKPYLCVHTMSRRLVFPETEEILTDPYNSYLTIYKTTEIMNPNMDLWTSCCQNERKYEYDDFGIFSNRQVRPVFKTTTTKNLIVYPGSCSTGIKTLFNNARKKWPSSVFSRLHFVEELRDDLYRASNIVIIVNAFSEKHFAYTIRNNVFSKDYQKDGTGSDMVVDEDLIHKMPSDSPNQSSEEFAAIQTAVNEAYIEHLKLKPVDWEICIHSKKNRYFHSYDRRTRCPVKGEGKRLNHLNSWLYISVSVLLMKLISDIMNNTSFVQILKFHQINPTFVYLMRAFQYILVSIFVSIPFLISKLFGYQYLFPCIDVKITGFAIFTFYVSSVSFVTLVASFFSRKSKGLCTVFAIWVTLHFISKWMMNYATNNVILIIMSMWPTGGLYASLTTMLNFEVVDHRDSLLFDWPRTPANVLPLGLIWFMMWLGSFSHLTLLFLNKSRVGCYFGHIKSSLVRITKFCRVQRLLMPSSSMDTDRTKNIIIGCTNGNPYKDVKNGSNFLNFSVPDESNHLVNYSLPQNTITVILGGRLSGKSNLLSAFVETPFCGQIFLQDEAATAYEETSREDVGFITHQCPLEGNLTMYEHLIFSALLKGFSIQEAKDMSVHIVKDMDLTSVEYTKINQLGAFQEFKVGLSVALLGNPKVLVLDELSSKLDQTEKAAVWNLLLDLRKKHTILISTTSAEEADSIGDYVGIVDHGRLLCFGTVSYLRNLFNEQYTIRFIPTASRYLHATESLGKITRNVSQKDMKVVVSCHEDEDIPKIMEVVDEFIDPSESNIETSYPCMLNIYAKAIGYDLLRSDELITSYFKEEKGGIPMRSNWCTKTRAHYIRMLWHNLDSQKLILVFCALLGLMANPRLNDCFKRNDKLPKVPIQTSYFDVPHINVTRSPNIYEDEHLKILHSNNFYSSPLAIDKIYNVLLSNTESSITTYHHPFVAIPSVCWDKRNYDGVFAGGESSDSCFFYVMQMVKYLFVSSSVVLAVIHQTERTNGLLEIHYLSGSSAYIYWSAAFLAGATMITTIYSIIIIKVILIIPSDELLSNFNIYWNLLMLFLYGVSFVNISNFFSLFINKKPSLAATCIFPIFTGIWLLVVLIFIYPPTADDSIEELFLSYFYNPLMAPLPPSLVRKFYCSICKDEWLDPAAQHGRPYEDPNTVMQVFWTIALLLPTLIFFLMIILKERNWLCGCSMWCCGLCRRFCTSNLEEHPKVEAAWKQEEFDGKHAFTLVITGTIGTQFPNGSWSRPTIKVSRGSCLGLLRRKESNISKFLKTIMKIPNMENAKHFITAHGDMQPNSGTMGYCSRRCELHDEMTARQQLSFFVRFRGLSGSKVKTVVDLWVRIMDLTDIADRKSREYDVNSRKKLGVALALIGSPFLAVLEDPTAGVDFRTRQTILSVIKHCNKLKNQTIIIVTQDPPECEDVCDHVMILHENFIEFNDDWTTLKYSLCKEPVLRMKFNPSSSKQDIDELESSLSREFPDSKYITERGFWRYYVFPHSQVNLSSIICQTEKIKVNHPIIQEIFVNVSSVDHVLENLDSYPKKTAITVQIQSGKTEVITSGTS